MRTARMSLVAALLAAACASHEGGHSDPEPTTTPVAAIAFRGAIASVSLVENCPDPTPAQAVAPAAMPASAERAAHVSEVEDVSRGASAFPGDSPDGGWSPSCTQSTMQLTLSHDGHQAQRFTIKAARLTVAGTGSKLGAVPVRGPSRWDEAGRYVPWDESLPAATELKASYKLGEPEWNSIINALGKPDTHDTRFVLEVDVEFAGRPITLRSPEFQREYPHVVVT